MKKFWVIKITVALPMATECRYSIGYKGFLSSALDYWWE